MCEDERPQDLERQVGRQMTETAHLLRHVGEPGRREEAQRSKARADEHQNHAGHTAEGDHPLRGTCGVAQSRAVPCEEPQTDRAEVRTPGPYRQRTEPACTTPEARDDEHQAGNHRHHDAQRNPPARGDLRRHRNRRRRDDRVPDESETQETRADTTHVVEVVLLRAGFECATKQASNGARPLRPNPGDASDRCRRGRSPTRHWCGQRHHANTRTGDRENQSYGETTCLITSRSWLGRDSEAKSVQPSPRHCRVRRLASSTDHASWVALARLDGSASPDGQRGASGLYLSPRISATSDSTRRDCSAPMTGRHGTSVELQTRNGLRQPPTTNEQ